MDKTHYEILGVALDALQKHIRAAYHQHLLRTHPDKAPAPNSSVGPGPSISELQAAYAILGDEHARQIYDEELKTAFKKQGFNITGAGLDFYTLSEFEEALIPDSDQYQWSKDCPRCMSIGAIVLLESDLERGTPDGAGGFQIVAPCLACSLWITVLYEEETEEPEDSED